MHEVISKGILSSNNGMNIYRGCTHGCIYCDARSLCYGMNHVFENIEVKVNAPQLLEEALKKKRKKCVIGTGAMSDPYIQLEEKLQNTRKCLEIIEKYGFGMIMGSSFWAFGTLIVILKEIIAMKYVSIDTIMAAFIILPIVFSVLAIMLPFQLKFGGEKGRIAIICTLVIVFLMGIVITKVSNAFHINLSFLFHQIATLNRAVLILAIIGFTILMLSISYRISLSIMKKKEF